MGCMQSNPDTVVQDSLNKADKLSDIEIDLTANDMTEAIFRKWDTNKTGFLEADQSDAVALQI